MSETKGSLLAVHMRHARDEENERRVPCGDLLLPSHHIIGICLLLIDFALLNSDSFPKYIYFDCTDEKHSTVILSLSGLT